MVCRINPRQLHINPILNFIIYFSSVQSVSGAHNAASSAVAAAHHASLFDLAASPDEIKLRLAGIPVFAVVNSKNEFVLVSGDNDEDRQLGLFFFNKEDAEGLIFTIKEQNPKLGKSAKIIATSMDAVYEFAVTPRGESGTEGVVFRFMPEGRQVENALELYRHAGLPSSSFTGVPLFQAEGLTVRGDAARYTPLFFSKDDLDMALKDAYMTRDNEAQAEARGKAERARSELQEAQTEAQSAAEGRLKKAAERKADAAFKRVQKYERQLVEATAKKSLPRVDVGCLEEVIVKMEADNKGEWGDVLFVPAGALNGGGSDDKNGAAAVKGKKK